MGVTPVAVKVQFRRDTAANWTSNNPVLSAGELGLETNTSRFKIGDGTTAWSSLTYIELPNTAVSVNLVDAKGDLLVGSADNTLSRVAVGANDTVLMADSAQTAGVKWGSIPVPTGDSDQIILGASIFT